MVLVEGSTKQVLKNKVVVLLFLLFGWEFLLIETKMCWFFVEEFLSSNRSFLFQLTSQHIFLSFLALVFALVFLLRLGVILHVDVIQVVIQSIDYIWFTHALLLALLIETSHVKRFHRFSLLYLLQSVIIPIQLLDLGLQIFNLRQVPILLLLQ